MDDILDDDLDTFCAFECPLPINMVLLYGEVFHIILSDSGNLDEFIRRK